MDIKNLFIDYFLKKGHILKDSVPLVPNDSSLLFTNSGMVAFKSIFTGEVPPTNPPRVVSSQCCIRAGGKHNDLDNVGYTKRHHTFFEMLGNFSFFDYFKEEAIAYSWEFVTKHLELDESRLYISVHMKDDEAFNIWKRHIKESHIKKIDSSDNFWQMGDVGPCGYCSEIFYDQGEENFNGKDDYLGGDGDRFLEIWNLVFMQFEKKSDGSLIKLKKPSIDTGMGLERVVALKEGIFDSFSSSLFMPIIKKIEDLIQKEYIYESGSSYRIIADHIRSTAFLIAQGVNFDKEGRGYVVRRIARRALKEGYMLGFKEPFMYKLVDTLIETLSGSYTYIDEKKGYIKNSIKSEEERFLNTIDKGIELFNKECRGGAVFSGEIAFKLYDTYGFPLDLTSTMAKKQNISVDIEGFEKSMAMQKENSKKSWKGSGDNLIEGDFKEALKEHGANSFIGYDTLNTSCKISALFDESFKSVKSLDKIGWVMFDKTPFYAESGGQVGDMGEIKVSDEIYGRVIDTQKFHSLNLSKIEVRQILAVGQNVKVEVDSKRDQIAKHHSATHLLHYVLKEVLGEGIAQAGSLVDKDKLRFDFSYPKAVSKEQLNSIGKRVNELIIKADSCKIETMDIDSAKKMGAVALFGDKYEKDVRVVTLGDSKELCGGCHVKNSSEIGMFAITKEGGVSSGVRRIEACCSNATYELFIKNREILEQSGVLLKNSDVVSSIKKLQDKIKQNNKELKEALNKNSHSDEFIDINGTKILISEFDGDIKSKIDDVKNRYERVAIMLFRKKDDKVLIACGCKGISIKASSWIKSASSLLGGGGGGRDDFAQAGGKNVQNLEKAKAEAKIYIERNI